MRKANCETNRRKTNREQEANKAHGVYSKHRMEKTMSSISDVRRTQRYLIPFKNFDIRQSAADYQQLLRLSIVCFALLTVLRLFLPTTLFAQSAQNSKAKSVPKTFYLNKISISGAKALDPSDLLAEMQTKPNTILFGFIRPWVGVYRFGQIFPDSTFLGDVGRFLREDIGEAPVVLKTKELQTDLNKLREIYENSGYFDVKVEADLSVGGGIIPEFISRLDTTQIDIRIRITEGKPTLVDTISFTGLDSLESELRDEILNNQIVKVGSVFAVKPLVAERERILKLFQDFGYAFMNTDSMKAVIDTADYRAGIRYRVSPSQRLDFGDVNVIIHDPAQEETELTKHEWLEEGVRIRYYGEEKLAKAFMFRSVAFRPNRRARARDKAETLRRFGTSGVFDGVQIDNDSVVNGKLFTTIQLKLGPVHQVRPELKLDNRNLSGNTTIFTSVAFGYLNRNLFKGAQSLSLTTSLGIPLSYSKGDFEALSNAGLRERNYFEEVPFFFDVGGELSLPYFTSEKSRLIVGLRYGFNQLPILIRSQNTSFRLRAQYAPNDFQRISFDMADLEIITFDSLNGLNALLNLQVRNPQTGLLEPRIPETQRDTILNLITQGRRLNQTLRLNFSFTNLTEGQRIADVRWNFLLEDAGFIVSQIDKYIDTRERSGFTDDDPQIYGLPYSQYRKATTTLALAKFFNREVEWAGKIILGYMVPVGKALQTPFERRFYAGGPNSLRGWGFNALGPGGNPNSFLSLFGADIKLELSLEWRYWFLKAAGRQSGVVIFNDVGNIWDSVGENALAANTLLSTTAWSAGFGFRFGTLIGPIRLDFAYRVHDPTRPEGDRWAFRKWNLTSFTFQFGIGEAF
jgi:outer membrane protein insertion porin family